MPLSVRGTTYAIPYDDGEKGVTGGELATIEDAFGVRDALLLLQLLGKDDAEIAGMPPGYTRWRAAYALAWIAMHRQDPAVSLAGVMDEYAADEFTLVPTGDPQVPDDVSLPASEG